MNSAINSSIRKFVNSSISRLNVSVVLCLCAIPAVLPPASPLATIGWNDIAPPVQGLLVARGLTAATFPGYVADLRRRNQARVREGDLDHLVYYVLQSTSFTDLPPIEPALSAAAFTKEGRVPSSARARIHAFERAVSGRPANARLAYFRELVEREKPRNQTIGALVADQYVRAMRFLYEKEFVARDKAGPPDEGAVLYQERGLSTDTSVDAGYVTYLALGTLRQLEPQRRIRRVLIVGPGLDLAPRTGLLETSAPQSYQPYAVIDALLGLGLATRDELRVTALDISPRVVDWLRQTRGTKLQLTVASGIVETARVRLSDDYRAYFSTLGTSIGTVRPAPATMPGRLGKSLEVGSDVTRAVDAVTADITLDHLDEKFDLAVVTNVFPYLSDVDLMLGLTNIVRMLVPGGVLLHNEPRPFLADAAAALRLPLLHSRSAVIATVEGARAPLYDAVWLHRAPESQR